MAQGSRQIQSQAQQQVQTLSPQQILVVKLLELPAESWKTVSMLNCLKIRHLKKVKKKNAADEYAEFRHYRRWHG